MTPFNAVLLILAAGPVGLLWAVSAGRSRAEARLVSLRQRAQATLAERRTNETRLLAAKDSAEAIARSKSQFLANMTHEMRTPLNGIIGMVELALETPLSVEQRDLLSTARGSAQGLLTIVNDVLDYEALESGRAHVDAAPFRMREILDAAVAPMRDPASRKKLAIRVETSDAVPAAFIGDGARVRQVLGLLVGNAIKFTAQGSVTVRVGLLQRDATLATLLFAVEDTGVGIPVEKHPSIFDAFTQGDGSTTRRHGGLGLGLALSRELVALLGGRLWLESHPGRGSVFFFTARLGIVDGAATASQAPVALGAALELALAPPAAAGTRATLDVLVAEDTEVNQELVQQILERRGHRVTVVGDGEAAVAAVATGSFDVVLMDVQMPLLDGFEATRRIRRAEAPGTHVPILALTAHSLRCDDARFRDAGMDGHIAKPFRIDELVTAVESAARDGVPSRAPIDRAAFLDRVGGDVGLFREIAATFCENLPRQRAAVATAVDAGDAEKLERAAHSLKGACYVVGAGESARLAESLEDLGESGSVAGAREIFAALAKELEAASAALGGSHANGLEAE